MSLKIKDADSLDGYLKTELDSSEHVPYHIARTEYASSVSMVRKTAANFSSLVSQTATSNAKSLVIYNSLDKDLYVALSGSASSANYSYVIPQYGTYESLPVNCRLSLSLSASSPTTGDVLITVTT